MHLPSLTCQNWLQALGNRKLKSSTACRSSGDNGYSVSDSFVNNALCEWDMHNTVRSSPVVSNSYKQKYLQNLSHFSNKKTWLVIALTAQNLI